MWSCSTGSKFSVFKFSERLRMVHTMSNATGVNLFVQWWNFVTNVDFIFGITILKLHKNGNVISAKKYNRFGLQAQPRLGSRHHLYCTASCWAMSVSKLSTAQTFVPPIAGICWHVSLPRTLHSVKSSFLTPVHRQVWACLTYATPNLLVSSPLFWRGARLFSVLDLRICNNRFDHD